MLGNITMNDLTTMYNLVGFFVVVFVAVAFITLAILYYASQKRIISSGLDDDKIYKEVKAELKQVYKHHKNAQDASDYIEQKDRRVKVLQNTVMAIRYIIVLGIALFIFISNMYVGDSDHIWFGNYTMITVQTESMETVHDNNRSFLESCGKVEEENRISRYSFLIISKKQSHIDSLQVGDVAAFTMKNADGETVTVVHRLVDIDHAADGTILYSFRGDANESTMTGEFRLPPERIVGVCSSSGFNGFKSQILGYIVNYLQSTLGIFALAVALVVMLANLIMADSIDAMCTKKYIEMRHDLFEEIFILCLYYNHFDFLKGRRNRKNSQNIRYL